MGTAIRTRIVKIGNSRIWIPIIIRPVARSRIGWDEAFAAMAEQNEDKLLDDLTPTEWERVEWEW